VGSDRRSSEQSNVESKLTSRQRFWLRHLRACDAAGKTIKEYATRKGLSPHGLYGARKRIRTPGVSADSANAGRDASFAKVMAREAPPEVGRCRVRLPNGMVMEWDVPLARQSLERFFQSVAHLS
jgi:hypothetical protein